jgi:transposase-like protein
MNENSQSLSVAAEEAMACKSISLEEKAEWARRFSESGLSIREFCAQHDLPRMSLWRWVNCGKEVRRAPTPSEAPAFKEIKLASSVEVTHWAAELSLPNGTVLRLSRDVPVEIFQQLLRVC